MSSQAQPNLQEAQHVASVSDNSADVSASNLPSSSLDIWLDRLMSPRNAAIATGVILIVSTGLSAALIRRRPASGRIAAELPAHFRPVRSLNAAPVTSATALAGHTPSMAKTSAVAVEEELEAYSPEARRAGRWLAIKALGIGTAACLLVNGVAAWAIGRALGIEEFSDWCKRTIPRRAAPVREFIYRDLDEKEVNAIPLESWSDLSDRAQLEWEREKVERRQQRQQPQPPAGAARQS
ncbi:hypothetical protein THASP1DRAFT_29686 [Thamnocephalis sphaerospora]|uniref:Transmembrane protein 242 n=1 Tax=Thamnocephalis sphaerospora TaxID=78915 RepID=A0A4P9XSX3_9FUNG|nr:hypothetical protein THASP1DRAFT_29686 [Thamnocephalis sphaerospora]|eukprot:RKP08510.1 hypothetical protein THASP1DRAFT_29686 [Thamnocephalis sphaerospora]